ncbi:MAG: endonuclease/exonuclease/phosphatase family protein [Bacteroidales bacterium]
MKTLIYSIAKYINIAIAIALLLAYISVYADPERFWISAFFGLSYPFLLFINLLFIIFWIYRKNKLLLISLIAVLIGWKQLRTFIQFPIRNKHFDTEKSFTVLSYNIRLFNLYNWSKDPQTPAKIFDFINADQFDIICFQEFITQPSGELSEHNIQKNLGGKYYVHYGYSHKNSKTNYGIATYSKYPIINRGTISFGNTSNMSIYTDVIIKKDTVRVFNNHLQSIRFNKNNYSFISNSKNLDEKTKFREAKDIIIRLREAFIKRATQSEILSIHIKRSPYPVIVCGDFNDTPVSYTYNKMSNKLNDSFMEYGKGIGNTYRGNFPSFRIDFILFSDDFKCVKFTVPKIKFSDHYPVAGRYVLKN